jgi:hypothetical protein
MKLCDELVEVNERICDMRPVPEIHDDKELSALKKKIAAAVYGEVQKEIDRIVRQYVTYTHSPRSPLE